MNYAAKVSGAGNQSYGKFDQGHCGINPAFILVLFILLVIILVACIF